MADIKSMLYQVLAPPHQRSLLCYLWWEESNLSKKAVDYQMCTLIFGGTSSPSCSNFAMKKAATGNSDKFGQEAAKTLLQKFCVDDLLKSRKVAEEAVSLTKNVVQRCAAGGFKRTKFISKHPDVLSAIREEDRKVGVKDQDLLTGKVPEERALGVLWNTDKDTLCCNINIMEKPLTRRGLLAMLSSICYPLGLVSPFSLKGRKTIQELYKGSFQWDHPIPENIKQQWIKWKSNLGKLNIIKIARCFKSKNFGHVKGYSVHHFSDASGIGYGQASYLHIANEDGKVHCRLLIGKEAAKTLLQNFYVDDLLKSRKGAEEAVSLTKNVVQRCTAGGFKLTKFISKHPDVLSAIREEDRKVGVKDQDLLTGKVPEERALGVLWNTDKDTLCCNINIMEKPLTRRGLLAMLSSIYDPLGLVSPFSLKGRKTIQ